MLRVGFVLRSTEAQLAFYDLFLQRSRTGFVEEGEQHKSNHRNLKAHGDMGNRMQTTTHITNNTKPCPRPGKHRHTYAHNPPNRPHNRTRTQPHSHTRPHAQPATTTPPARSHTRTHRRFHIIQNTRHMRRTTHKTYTSHNTTKQQHQPYSELLPTDPILDRAGSDIISRMGSPREPCS